MNIRHIEVDGQIYEIDAQNNIVVSINEPTGENRLAHWIKYKGIKKIRYDIGFEHTEDPENGMNYYYDIDENGDLLQITSTSSSIPRATKMIGLFKNMQYRLFLTSSYMFSEAYTILVYFYNINKEYVSSKEIIIENGINHDRHTILDTFELPEDARYVRFKLPNNYSELFGIAQAGANISEDTDSYGMYGESTGSNIRLYELDDDHYVEV